MNGVDKVRVYVTPVVLMQVMTLSNGEHLVMSERNLKLVLESESLKDTALPTLARCVSGTVDVYSTYHAVIGM